MKFSGYKLRIEKLQNEVSRLESVNARLREDFDRKMDVVNSALHEVRRFSAQLSRFSGRLNKDAENSREECVRQAAQSVFYTSGMISARLAYMDIELNPSALENQTTVRAGIYKKFDKAKRILIEESRAKDVNIVLSGESHVEIEVLPIFELLPFVLLENGIKYSPVGQSVDVGFEFVLGRQFVTISSKGPDVDEGELQKLCDRRFRGSNVSSMPGEGLGLFLVKRICDYHDIEMRLEVPRRNLYQLQGVNYCEFKVVLKFPKTTLRK